MDAMIVLGPYVERAGGDVQLLKPRNEKGLFENVLVQLKLWVLHARGLPLQAAQSLGRLAC